VHDTGNPAKARVRRGERLRETASLRVTILALMDLECSIASVKDMLFADPRVSAAILFGSAARGVARPSSDLDVAIVAVSRDALSSIDAEYLDLVGRLTHAARRDIHLVLLDTVEPVLGRQAFLDSRKLFDRDPGKTADVLERILVEYFDGEYHRRMRAEALERRRESRRG
jgi:predicted nucleotidyltransferase